MIYTVTLNPAIDKTAEIPSFAVDAVNRIVRVRKDPGGKGINVSKVIESLGGDSVAYAVLGGDTGKELEKMLSGHRFQLESIRTEYETRTNIKIVDPTLHTNTDINEPGTAFGSGTLEELKQSLRKRLTEGDILVLSGSVPAGTDKGIYGELTVMGKECGAKVFLDADGELFARGVDAVPFLVKPNRFELEQYFGRQLRTREELCGAGRELLEKGIRVVLISLGADGAVLCRDDGNARGQEAACRKAASQETAVSLCRGVSYLWAEGLSVPVASTVGAGDSMTAAFAYGVDRKMDCEDAFRLSVSAGSAAVTCSGSQAPDVELIWKLYEQVKLRRSGV